MHQQEIGVGGWHTSASILKRSAGGNGKNNRVSLDNSPALISVYSQELIIRCGVWTPFGSTSPPVRFLHLHKRENYPVEVGFGAHSG
jgi:hypothetical protein